VGIADCYTACAYYTVGEVPPSAVLAAARVVVDLLDDADQLRTGSMYEDSSIRCAREFVITYASESNTDFDTI
jgi:hypothetical protein